MGFFSWQCPTCDHSIRHRGACAPSSKWLSEAVAVYPNGDRISGEYDGYGRIGGRDVDGDVAIYHRACYKLAGEPSFRTPSEAASDQGHFVGEYDPKKPKSAEDCARLREVATVKREQERQEALAFRAKMKAEYLARGEEPPAWL